MVKNKVKDMDKDGQDQGSHPTMMIVSEHTRRTRPDEQTGSLKVVDPRWAFVLLNSMVQPAEG